MFILSDKTKQIIQDTTGLTWDEILVSGLPKIKNLKKKKKRCLE